jgi:hypothetical protein
MIYKEHNLRELSLVRIGDRDRNAAGSCYGSLLGGQADADRLSKALTASGSSCFQATRERACA